MADTLQSVLIGGAAGFVSAVLTHFSTRARLRLDLAAEYDKQLQEARLTVYKDLWQKLEPTARYGREPVTHAVLRRLSNDSRTWYFRSGGIYLTQRTRTPYFEWKKQLDALLRSERYAKEPEKGIADAELEPMLAAASALRTALSDDIGTKRLTRI